MRGMAIWSRGRAPALCGGCSLQMRFDTLARSYPTGMDVDPADGRPFITPPQGQSTLNSQECQ